MTEIKWVQDISNRTVPVTDPSTWVSNSSIATYWTGSVGKVPFNFWWNGCTFGNKQLLVHFLFGERKLEKKHTQGKVVHQDLRLGLFPQVLLVVIRKRRPFLRGGAHLNSISHLFWSHWLKLPNKAPETPTRPTEAAFPFFRGVLGLILTILGNPAMIFWWNACTHGTIAFLLEEASSAHLCETSILVAFLRVVLVPLCAAWGLFHLSGRLLPPENAVLWRPSLSGCRRWNPNPKEAKTTNPWHSNDQAFTKNIQTLGCYPPT